jgi:hypothetical protein
MWYYWLHFTLWKNGLNKYLVSECESMFFASSEISIFVATYSLRPGTTTLHPYNTRRLFENATQIFRQALRKKDKFFSSTISARVRTRSGNNKPIGQQVTNKFHQDHSRCQKCFLLLPTHSFQILIFKPKILNSCFLCKASKEFPMGKSRPTTDFIHFLFSKHSAFVFFTLLSNYYDSIDLNLCTTVWTDFFSIWNYKALKYLLEWCPYFSSTPTFHIDIVQKNSLLHCVIHMLHFDTGNNTTNLSNAYVRAPVAIWRSGFVGGPAHNAYALFKPAIYQLNEATLKRSCNVCVYAVGLSTTPRVRMSANQSAESCAENFRLSGGANCGRLACDPAVYLLCTTNVLSM